MSTNGQNTNDNNQEEATRNRALSVETVSSPYTRFSATGADVLEHTEVTSYNHKANIYPPYVLDTLSRVHYKDQLNNSNVNLAGAEAFAKGRNSLKRDEERQYVSFENDPYVQSVNKNWHDLLHSVQMKQANIPGTMHYDRNFSSEYKLEGEWGGEERLKSALLGAVSSKEEEHGTFSTGILSKFTSMFYTRKARRYRDFEHPKVRSRAGYWMSDEKRADVVPTLKRILVHNPLFPLFLRVLIIVFSLASLALACTIYTLSRDKYNGHPIDQEPSTIMAVVVQCFAVVYLIYIAYDEYSGKPLGLRNPLGKMKLIMLDLLFIIFSSANLALAFNTLYESQWVCHSLDNSLPESVSSNYPYVFSICRRQKALAAFLLVALCLWVLTFSISVTRLVDKVSTENSRPQM